MKDSERERLHGIIGDLKWAIKAVASARCAFLTQAFTSRLAEIENDLIQIRNQTIDMAGIKR